MNALSLHEKSRIIGKLQVKWFLTPNQSFTVAIYKIGMTLKSVRKWVFPPDALSEIKSFCWYEYVSREIRTHQQISRSSIGISRFLKTVATEEVERLINMIFEGIRK